MCGDLYIGPGPSRSIGPEPDADTTGYGPSNVPRNFDQPSPVSVCGIPVTREG